MLTILSENNLKYLLGKTAKILPNNPTAQGWSAERIKKCYYEGFQVLFEWLKKTQQEVNDLDSTINGTKLLDEISKKLDKLVAQADKKGVYANNGTQNFLKYYSTSAEPDTLVERLPDGSINVITNDENFSAVNVQYLRLKLEDKLDKIKEIGSNRVYGVDTTGSQISYILDIDPTAESIIKRDANGKAKSETPNNEDSPKTIVNKQYVDNILNKIEQQSDVVDIVSSYQDLLNYDKSLITPNDLIKVLQDETHDNAITYYRLVNNEWSLIGQIGPYYTTSQVDEKVDTGITAASNAMSAANTAATEAISAATLANEAKADVRALNEQTKQMYGQTNQADIQRLYNDDRPTNPVKGQIFNLITTNENGEVTEQKYLQWDGTKWEDLKTNSNEIQSLSLSELDTIWEGAF